MSIETYMPLRGWHKGAPTKEDFAKGELLVIYEHELEDKLLYGCHNVGECANDFMIRSKYKPVYWMKFKPRLSLPDYLDDVTVTLSWRQEGGAEVCFGG